MVLKCINSKQIILKKCTSIMFGQCFKSFSVDNMTKIGLCKYTYSFSVDYDSIDVDDILDVHKYLMK